MSEQRRSLYVPMEEILDALDSGPGSPQFYLHTGTGEVTFTIEDGSETDPDEDPDQAAVPPQDLAARHRAMEDFVAGIDEEDIREELASCLRGRGVIGRFERTARRWPDVGAAWQARRRALLLEQALGWMRSLGIEPQFELTAIVVPQPAGRPAVGKARVGLFDLLLLGAPAPRSGELPEGQAFRGFTAASEDQARAVFQRLARELAEHHGVAWRRRFIEDRDDYRIERCLLTIVGRTVELRVDVPAETAAVFPRSR